MQKTAYEIGLGIPAEPLFRSKKFIAFRWIHLSTPLIRLFLLVLILLLMPTLNFLPVWFALSLLRFRLQIGRASCRERVYICGSARSLLIVLIWMSLI